MQVRVTSATPTAQVQIHSGHPLCLLLSKRRVKGGVHERQDRYHDYRYDGGTTWTDTWPTGGSSVSSLAWSGTYLYAGCNNGYVYRYKGGAWTSMGYTGGLRTMAEKTPQ
jgi:hypothetical protein